MLFFVSYFLAIVAVPVQKLNGKVFIGYWGADAEFPPVSQIPEALKRGYNVISLAFGDTLKSDGSFKIHTNSGVIPKKDWFSQNADIDPSSWQYLLSFGGINAAVPTISDTQAYVNGFMKCFMDAHIAYGFDGIDIYGIETGMTPSFFAAFRQIFQTLHQKNFVISMAPQPINIDPAEFEVFVDGSLNAYVPLIDSTIIDSVSYIIPRMYDNTMPMSGIVSYLESLQKSHVVLWEGSQLVVNIPPEKILFGYPAADRASLGPMALWEDSGKGILHKYQTNPALMATGGIMAWSIGWDEFNNWDFIDNVSKIWARNKLNGVRRFL